MDVAAANRDVRPLTEGLARPVGLRRYGLEVVLPGVQIHRLGEARAFNQPPVVWPRVVHHDHRWRVTACGEMRPTAASLRWARKSWWSACRRKGLVLGLKRCRSRKRSGGTQLGSSR